MFKLLFSCFLLVVNLCAKNTFAAEIFEERNDHNSAFRISPGIGCEIIGYPFVADMVANPIYQFDGVQCEAVLPSASGNYYTDAACTDLISFRHTSHQDFCDGILDKYDWIDDRVVPGEWVLSTGTTYDGTVASLDGLTQPYRTSVNYLTHNSDRGECRLEMRIYKNNPGRGQNNLRPIIALHGGTWTTRDVGVIGVENMAARYTDKGFVVFAPFFRLLSDLENDACNEATMADILSDLEAALSWVENNGQQYGVSGKPVLFGQSSGAQSALALSVAHPQRIAGAVLLYPITDFGDFLSQVQSGEYDDTEGKLALSAVFGSDYDELTQDEPFIVENSYPSIIRSQPLQYPPMMILHGEADKLVPVRQVTRLCNALAGRDLDFKLYDPGLVQKRFICGQDQELRLYVEAGHAMEVCVSTSQLLSFSCFSGGAESQQAIAEGLENASRWAASMALKYGDEVANVVDDSSSGDAGNLAGSGGDPVSELPSPDTVTADNSGTNTDADTNTDTEANMVATGNLGDISGGGVLLLQFPGCFVLVVFLWYRRSGSLIRIGYDG